MSRTARIGSVAGLIAASMVAATVASYAQDPQAPIVRLPNDINYSGAAGAAQTVVLYGDPKKAELYVVRLRFPAGFKAMPHSHPDAQRTVAVLSGTLYFAVGERWDEAKLKPYPAGTFYTEPKGLAHFAWAKDGEVVVQLTAIGPTGMTPVSAPVR